MARAKTESIWLLTKYSTAFKKNVSKTVPILFEEQSGSLEELRLELWGPLHLQKTRIIAP